MRRDELVDGAWYLVKGRRCYKSRHNWELLQLEDGKMYRSDIVSFDPIKDTYDDVEWARVNPEEIFNSVPLNSQDGK